MRITRSLRRATAVALLAALPILAAPAVSVAQPDRAVVAEGDPGWGRAPLTEPVAAPLADPGWG
ncbi:hypothetical protein [Streptomyces cyaneofuscatus]|uniref:hypothetical protein n=1 Tax=Streptomyces cyaneofuscatus TaxID=66883 RepID=UPI0038118FB3